MTGSSYLFSISFLQQLSRELKQPDFNPTSSQKVVLEHALRLLDWELNRQAVEQPALMIGIEQWLAIREEETE